MEIRDLLNNLSTIHMQGGVTALLNTSRFKFYSVFIFIGETF